MYSTTNSGGSDSGSEEIGVCSRLELLIGVSTTASKIVSRVPTEMAGMELEIAEFDEVSSDVDGVAASRPGERLGSETLSGTNFFLHLWQILLRRLSSSS